MDEIAALAEGAPAGWLAVLALTGLLVGSFLNVVIYRLPIMLEARWLRDATAQLGLPQPVGQPGYHLGWPPSFCPHCRESIALKDNIPVLGWLLLRGRCRCCRLAVSAHYPLIESLTMALFMAAGVIWPAGMALWGALILLSFLIVLAVIDIQTRLLPDGLTLPLLWLGLTFNLSGTFVPLDEAVIGAIAGYSSLWMLFWGYKLFGGGEALGYGDFKLLAALGGWLGWRALPNLVLVATLSGLVVTVAWRQARREKINQPLAFGPWLAIGGAIGAALNGIGGI